MAEDETSHKQLAIAIVESSSHAERTAIRNWAVQLLDIRSSNLSRTGKARAAIAVTLSSKVIWPAVKIAARKTKQIGWDDRSRTARFGIAGATAGLTVFGTQGAGIAALGTAIGVPLWVVIGAGASFANVLIEEITRRGSAEKAETTYSVIEAKRIDPPQ